MVRPPMLMRAAASNMSFMRAYTGASGRPLRRAYSEHLASISSRVMCSHPKSLIAACPGNPVFHSRIALAQVSCAIDNFFSVWSSIGQKISKCLKALKTRDFHMIKSCGMGRWCFAASCAIAHVRWLPILRKTLSNWILRRYHCIRSPK